MPRLVAAHARPIAGGVDTLMAISDTPTTDLKEAVRNAFLVHLDTPLAFAGASALLGSKKPAFWALVGLGVSLFVNKR